jgi:hypothetical protein
MGQKSRSSETYAVYFHMWLPYRFEYDSGPNDELALKLAGNHSDIGTFVLQIPEKLASSTASVSSFRRCKKSPIFQIESSPKSLVCSCEDHCTAIPLAWSQACTTVKDSRASNIITSDSVSSCNTRCMDLRSYAALPLSRHLFSSTFNINVWPGRQVVGPFAYSPGKYAV